MTEDGICGTNVLNVLPAPPGVQVVSKDK